MAEAIPFSSSLSPKDQRQRNRDTSLIIKCPPEIHKLLATHLLDPIDLKNFSHVCEPFYRIVDSRDWWNSFQSQYPAWSKGCRLEEVPDNSDGSSGWKRLVLKDSSMCQRITAPLPPGPDSSMDLDPPKAALTSTASSADEHPYKRPRVLLNEALEFKSDPNTVQGEWRRTGSPVYFIDETSNTVISASMLMQPTIDGGSSLDNHRILLYDLSDLKNPLAILTSEFWTKQRDDREAWCYPFLNNELKVGQVMDIRHYPSDIRNGEMRVVMVIAFGENAGGPVTQDQEDVHVLDVWLIVKIVEIWLPAKLTSGSGTQPSFSDQNPRSKAPAVRPRVDRVETIEPSQNQNYMRGRIAKLYVAKTPKIAQDTKDSEGEKGSGSREKDEEVYDCITLFGMKQSDSSPALVIKKVLFQDKKKGDSSWSKKQISRGVSCMTVFPYYSNFERMLVLFNRHGRGMIWDWVNERQVAQLHLDVDNHANLSPNDAIEAAKSAAVRKSLFYWGVQVSRAIEVPDLALTDRRQQSSFRVVTLADGIENEWESCWWHVDSTMLGPDSEMDLEAPPFGQMTSGSAAAGEPKAPLYANARRYEKETLGYCLPEQRTANMAEDGQPVKFIAYVIWNHFRIGLTAQLGLTMVDMEGDANTNTQDREWVTFLDKMDENPLVDIATIGDNLIITRRNGHMIWPFYGRDRG